MSSLTPVIVFYLLLTGILLLPPFVAYTQRSALKSRLVDTTRIRKLSPDTIPGLTRKAVTDLRSNIAVEKEKLFTTPVVRFREGYVNYDFSYRTNIDTPYTEHDISQHNITGRIDVTAGNVLPLTVTYWVRKSNSSLYSDMAGAQVQFDANGFRQRLIEHKRKRLTAALYSIPDSLTEKAYANKLKEWESTKRWLKSPFNIQQLQEYNEMLQVPAISKDLRLPDSLNNKKADSLQQVAKQFIARYDSTKKKYDYLTTQTDSLKKEIDLLHTRSQQWKQLTNSRFTDWQSYKKWKEKVKEYQSNDVDSIQDKARDKYQWLMGIRNFSIGKTPLNYSELTVKNISITGVNIEYNSWYYAAFAAGAVDYQFRDFVTTKIKRSPQYLYLGRLGLGRLEHSHFIVTAWHGQKQLYDTDSTSSRSATIAVTGFAAQTRWQVNKSTYITAEIAQSLSPDYRTSPATDKEQFSLSNKINKALAIKLYSVLPATSSVLEGMYKYTGANFQSFSSFQNNAAIQTWYLKWEQHFFRRKLHVTTALRSNEYTNPYIIQNYKSNTVFKSINAVFRTKKWPTLTVGYVPMSQLTVTGEQVMESRFQTLTASANHFYHIGRLQAASAIVYNRFYNGSSDTGFVYYNSTNFYVTQHFMFGRVGVLVAVSHSQGSQYRLNVMEENIRFQLGKRLTVALGAKVNNLDGEETKLGALVNANLIITQKDIITINFERGFLPSNNQHLVRSDMGSIQYSRAF